MGGLGFLLFLIGYIWLGSTLVRAVWHRSSRSTGIATLLIFMALTFADALLGRVVLHHKCETEGKISIFERRLNIEGIGVQSGVFKDLPQYYGYRYVEGDYSYNYESSPWMFERAELSGNDSETTIKKKVSLRAEYLLHEGSRQDSTYFYKKHISVRELKTGRELSSFDWFYFRGGWFERIAMAFSDAGPSSTDCGGYETKINRIRKLLHETLQPASP